MAKLKRVDINSLIAHVFLTDNIEISSGFVDHSPSSPQTNAREDVNWGIPEREKKCLGGKTEVGKEKLDRRGREIVARVWLGSHFIEARPRAVSKRVVGEKEATAPGTEYSTVVISFQCKGKVGHMALTH